MTVSLASWAERLVRLGESTPSVAERVAGSEADVPGSFRDEFGHRRAEDGPFLAAHLGVAWRERAGDRAESRLWALAAGRGHATTGSRSGDLSPAITEILGPSDEDGALLYGRRPGAIESATDGELCALHALWTLGARDPAWRDRALRAAAWCLGELQPDNATNEPWGLHVFLILELSEGRPEGGLYAQTLLQNAMVGGMGGGRLPARAGWIVRDAGMSLRRYLDEQ